METTSKSSNFMIFMLVGSVVDVSSPRCTEDGLGASLDYLRTSQDHSGPIWIDMGCVASDRSDAKGAEMISL